MVFDLLELKKLGFNTVRKHVSLALLDILIVFYSKTSKKNKIKKKIKKKGRN